MSDFEEYIKNKYPEDYAVLSTMYSNQAMEELYPDQFEVWRHQQAIINDLKAQLECCRKENAVLLGKVGELEKNEFLLARVKTILGSVKKTNLLESIIVRDLRKVLRGEHEDT